MESSHRDAVPDASILADALDDLILGRGVKRGRHHLGPAAAAFRARLSVTGFVETRVAAVDLEVGVRVPAWLLRGATADFGTVFWELFTDTFRRKLFGSEVRNAKGDWDVVLPTSSLETVWVNEALAESYDASRPVGMF